VRQLEQAGVIRQYVALLDPRAVGLGVLAYVNVKLEKRAPSHGGRLPSEDFRDAVASWAEVVVLRDDRERSIT
jgi:Lrp/AsnC family leucine-responsive transcriptional regulator